MPSHDNDIRFNGFEKFVNIEYVFVSIYNNSVDIVLAYGYNDLFPTGAFGSHVDLGTYLLCATLCISIIFLVDSLEKTSFILKISLALPLVVCTKDLIFPWCLDFTRTFALGLGEMGGRILDILARLVLFFSPWLMCLSYYCEATRC